MKIAPDVNLATGTKWEIVGNPEVGKQRADKVSQQFLRACRDLVNDRKFSLESLQNGNNECNFLRIIIRLVDLIYVESLKQSLKHSMFYTYL